MSQIQHVQNVNTVADTVTATAAVGSLLGWLWGYLPGIISVLVGIVALVWYLIQIHESKMFQRWRATRHRRKLRRQRFLHRRHR